MNRKQSSGKEIDINEARKRLALALLAMYDMEGAEAIAKAEGLPFNRDLAFKQVEAMLGKKEADAMRYRWSPEAEEASFQRSRKKVHEAMRLMDEERAKKVGK